MRDFNLRSAKAEPTGGLYRNTGFSNTELSNSHEVAAVDLGCLLGSVFLVIGHR